jgi:hypothetical protein
MDHLFICKFGSNLTIHFVADLLILSGALDRYDYCTFHRVKSKANDYTAVPIIFSAIFGVG